MTLCACGCGDEAGIGATGQLRRFLPHHHQKLQSKKRWEDYPSPVRDVESGCLRWQGPHHSAGYGRIGSKAYAHQMAYEREYGPIPEGTQIDHVAARGCRYRDCVEPTHLEAVTQAENVRRSRRIQSQIARTHCPQGHEYSGHNLIHRRGRRECRACTYARNERNRRARREERVADRDHSRQPGLFHFPPGEFINSCHRRTRIGARF